MLTVKELINTMESYTNGGLILIQEKIDENPNFFLQPPSFLYMILDSKLGKKRITKPEKILDATIGEIGIESSI